MSTGRVSPNPSDGRPLTPPSGAVVLDPFVIEPPPSHLDTAQAFEHLSLNVEGKWILIPIPLSPLQRTEIMATLKRVVSDKAFFAKTHKGYIFAMGVGIFSILLSIVVFGATFDPEGFLNLLPEDLREVFSKLNAFTAIALLGAGVTLVLLGTDAYSKPKQSLVETIVNKVAAKHEIPEGEKLIEKWEKHKEEIHYQLRIEDTADGQKLLAEITPHRAEISLTLAENRNPQNQKIQEGLLDHLKGMASSPASLIVLVLGITSLGVTTMSFIDLAQGAETSFPFGEVSLGSSATCLAISAGLIAASHQIRQQTRARQESDLLIGREADRLILLNKLKGTEQVFAERVQSFRKEREDVRRSEGLLAIRELAQLRAEQATGARLVAQRLQSETN